MTAQIMANRREGAFAFRELLAVLAAVALLHGLAAPALLNGKRIRDAATCLQNKKQLILAWQLYASENDDRLVPNYHGGAALPGSITIGWAAGWLDWALGRDNTNELLLVSERYALLAPYLADESEIFRCPADTYISPVQKARGWKKRVRSISANIGLGAGNAVTGPWDPTYQQVIKMSDFLYPGPAGTWVHIDEHPDSINDPAFYHPRVAQFVDLPASFHHNGGGLSFADGHTELHRWRGAAANVPVRIGAPFPAQTRPGDPDIAWLSYHTSRRSTNYYH